MTSSPNVHWQSQDDSTFSHTMNEDPTATPTLNRDSTTAMNDKNTATRTINDTATRTMNGAAPTVNGAPGPAGDESRIPRDCATSSRTQRFQRTCCSYLVALRPWSFTASLTPVALGTCLAYKDLERFNVFILLAACLTALSVHAAGNLVNTYFDYVKGVDSKKSDDRTLVDQILSTNDVATMGGICYALGCVGFVILVTLSPARMEHLALIYFGGLSSSFLYTGGMGLKYVALGDVLIFLSFGPVTVLFAYMTQGGQLSWIPLLYAVPLALNTEAILHSNNTRDMDTDREAGIVTLAIILGKTASYILFALLLFTPYIIFAIMTVNFSIWFALPTVTVILAFKYERLSREGNMQRMPVHMAKLNLQLGMLYVLACGLAPRSHLPGFS